MNYVCDVANIIGSSTATASHHLRLFTERVEDTTISKDRKDQEIEIPVTTTSNCLQKNTHHKITTIYNSSPIEYDMKIRNKITPC